MKKSQIALMAVGAGGVVANIYYIQPLLALIAAEFHISVTHAGAVAMLSQFGTALGMLFFVPLGDTKERRGLILRLVLLACVCLLLMAMARNLVWLSIASFSIGLASATVHVILPYAAHLAPADRRGKIVGIVFSGILLGILLARTVSGLLAGWLGWRSVYWVAAMLMLVLAALFRAGLPKSEPSLNLPWIALVRSAGELIRTQPTLREAAILGALFFAAFSAFWTTLVFFLQTPPYHYGSQVAGLFGLVGAVGAAGAPLVGRSADRYGPRITVLMGLVITLFSFVLLFASGKHLAGLIVGVILLDFGVQAGHVSNQARIYALIPEARSRLNMVYMVTYFTAGALGSYLGTLAFDHYAWPGVCAFGAALMAAGCAIHFRGNPKALDEAESLNDAALTGRASTIHRSR